MNLDVQIFKAGKYYTYHYYIFIAYNPEQIKSRKMGQCEFCYPHPQNNENSIKVKSNIRIKFQLLPLNQIMEKNQSAIILRQFSSVDLESQLSESNIMMSDVEDGSGLKYLSIKFKYDRQAHAKIFQDYYELRQELDKLIQAVCKNVEQHRLQSKRITIRFDEDFLKNLPLPQSLQQKVNLLSCILNQFRSFQPYPLCRFQIVVSMGIKKCRKKIMDICEGIKKNTLEDSDEMMKRLQKQKQKANKQPSQHRAVITQIYEPAPTEDQQKSKQFDISIGSIIDEINPVMGMRVRST